MNTKNEVRCFYSPGRMEILALVDSAGLTQVGRLTLSAMRSRFPDCMMLPMSEAIKRMDDSLKMFGASETNELYFCTMLNSGRIRAWTRGKDGSESYLLADPARPHSNISIAVVRVSSRFFCLPVHHNTGHEAIVSAVLGQFPKLIN